jgi:hypothetical protein
MLETDNNMRVLTLLLVFLLPLPIAALGQKAVECNGPYKDKKLTGEELKQVLEKHREWRPYTPRPEHLNSTDPRRANLCGADLKFAKLAGADLSVANLSGAILYSADLSGADLSNAELSGAILSGANLQNANLQSANLIEADLSAAELFFAELPRADLSHANLSGAFLVSANLTDADLPNANLSHARLDSADLSGADLSGANLTDAYFIAADLTSVIYEPDAGKQPPVDAIAQAEGLSELIYYQPRGLVSLRKLFNDGGYRDQERQITYAINHVRTERLLAGSENLTGRVEGAFNYVLFELTTNWGLAPSRALSSIAVLILLFSLAYVIALRNPEKDGIWRIWSSERVRDDLGSDKPELLSLKGFSTIKMAFYFSLLSAFHIGWRDLNVGNWITRVQPREYTLRASGWVRTVSGIQSLLSVYLLAIWALTYFGRPFE